MSLYKNIKERVRRTSVFSTRSSQSAADRTITPSFPVVQVGNNSGSLSTRTVESGSAARNSEASLPTRPPRSEALLIPNIISLNTPTAVPARSRSPRGPIPPFPAHDPMQPQSSSSSSTTPVAGSAWFVPVPILDRRAFTFEYQFGGTLGEGGFGKVVLALHVESKQQFAIKVIAIRRLRSRRETASVANEIKVLRRVSQTASPFLARPAKRRDWYWQYQGNVHLVMEYYCGGDLGRSVEYHEELKNPTLFKRMVAEVVIGILALHDMGIIHHDIKPGNILVDAHGHCVLTDYGGSCFIASDSSSRYDWRQDRTPIFTLRYAAPEVLMGSKYGPAIDFWSLGVTLFELATGEELVDDPDDNQAVYNIQHGFVDLGQLVLLSGYPGLHAFVEELLISESSYRLQGQQIKRHNYFSSFQESDWAATSRQERPPFRPNKHMGINPRNTSYDYIERPGESLLQDANEDIVERWFAEEGVSMPHHKHSGFHRIHQKNARVGVPVPNARRLEHLRNEMSDAPRHL
ncbi:kinase-like protein [Rickenella mellea]|uniref:Kinase-like protein n=1 Tax=Rickenella mellea TaxID=50990 RepID=A0A4Y7PY36_9AGAM|nr:kinase-like protein [Rickenella mellea]